MARVADERARSGHAAPGSLVATQHVLGAVLAGAVAAGLSLVLVGKDLAGRGVHSADDPLAVGMAGALWAALYAAVGLPVRWPEHRRPAAATLGAAGLSVVLAPVVSMPAVIEAGRRWLEAGQSSVGVAGLLMGAGLGALGAAVAGARLRPADT